MLTVERLNVLERERESVRGSELVGPGLVKGGQLETGQG